MVVRMARGSIVVIASYSGILAAGLLGVSMVASLYGIGMLDSMRILITSPFSDLLHFSEIFVRFIAIYTIALGVSIALKAGLWNIGGEGQFLVGAVMALYIAKAIQAPYPQLAMTIMILGASLAAMLWALPPAFLKARFGVNEIVTTLMLNIVAASFTLYALDGPIRGQASYGYLLSDVLPPSLRFPVLLRIPMQTSTGIEWVDTRLSYSIFVTIALAVVLYIAIERSPLDIHLGVVGKDWRIASYAGINVFRVVVLTMLLAGALAGLSGALHVMGVLYRFDSGQIDHGFGYLAVLAAALGRSRIPLTALTSLLISILVVGGESLLVTIGATYAITWVAVGLMMIAIPIAEKIVGEKR